MNKKIFPFLILFSFFIALIYSKEIPYPFIYVPGMFDNGDTITKDSMLAKNLNNKNGFYYKKYFTKNFSYDKEAFLCSSNIVDTKYNRLVVANLIGPFRTNISLWLMADRLFALMHGKAPGFVRYNNLINYQGNDYNGTCIRDNKTVIFNGVLEEAWAKYGKKVHYKEINGKFTVSFYPEKHKSFYVNKEGLFDSPDEIKFNFVVHSSGGIALRRYIQMCNNKNISNHINTIINLSVPQKGARLMYNLKKAFPELIKEAMNNFFLNKENGSITIKNEQNKHKALSYDDLIKRTRIKMLYGDSVTAVFMRNIIGYYILYNIPFDGRKRVLGTDPALRDLHPDHRLIKSLSKEEIPENIQIHNFRVTSAYAKMFVNLGKYLGLEENDGAVDFRDTTLSHLPNSDKLQVKDHIVKKANHIPFPHIKPLFELRNTIKENYAFLKILLKDKTSKEDGIDILYAVIKAIMIEFGLDLEYLLKNENYSIIDHFAENPIDL